MEAVVKYVIDCIPAIMAIFIGLVIIYYTRIVYKIRVKQAKFDEGISEITLESKKQEHQFQQEAFSKTRDISDSIAHQIANLLAEDPTWLDRFMDITGVTYAGSVYGKRIRHFFYEKKRLAEEAIKWIENRLDDTNKKFCLIIDSGTSMYHVFHEIGNRIRDPNRLYIWRERICIVTNNLPGVQYLMKYCKEDPYDDYSEIALKCFLLPGKPLSIYAAVTSKETVNWLDAIDPFVSNELKCSSKNDYEIIGFVTGNYMCRHKDGNEISFRPVARGEGHVEIKEKFVKVSDKVILLAPLMKFSFADVELLNIVNEFTIDRSKTSLAKSNPSKVKYVEIKIDKEKCIFITTQRNKADRFYLFSELFKAQLLESYPKSQVRFVHFDLQSKISNVHNKAELEIELEIPHENLRERYQKKGKNIWDLNWVHNQNI